MPQHQRTGVRYTARRIVRGLAIKADVRRRPAAPREDPTDPQRTQRPRTTVDATLVPGSGDRYKTLWWGAGEPHVRREDLGAKTHSDVRSARSLLYFGHHTDVHLCDAQSPARMETGERLAWVNPGTDAGHRPQELTTLQVF